MSKPPTVAEIMVVVGRPPKENPFLASRESRDSRSGYSLAGESRKAALKAFQEGQPGFHTFWDTRNSGFVEGREITSSDQVDW